MFNKIILITLLGITPTLAISEAETARQQQQALFDTCRAQPNSNLSEICYGFKVAMKYCANFKTCIPQGSTLVSNTNLMWSRGDIESPTPFLLRQSGNGQVLLTAQENDIPWQVLMAQDPTISPWVMVPLNPLTTPMSGYGAVLGNPIEGDFQGAIQGGD